jgi:hypothetical protein
MLHVISRAIEDGDVIIQQGGVCYPTVSHGRTKMLLGSPIRDCVIVNEIDLRPVHGVCEGRIRGFARARRDRSMVLSERLPTTTRPRQRGA